MATTIQMERQYQVRDASGNIIWTGVALIGVDLQATESDANAAHPATAGDTWAIHTAFIQDDVTASVLGSGYNPGTSDPVFTAINVKATEAATSVGFLGVAYEPVEASGRVKLAGLGSIIMVNCTTAAAAVGTQLTGSATAGLVAADAKPLAGETLGTTIIAKATIDTGLFAAGVLVTACGALSDQA